MTDLFVTTRKLTLCSLVVALFVLVGGCADPGKPSFKKTFYRFGTLVEVTLVAADSSRADAGFALIESKLSVLHKQWHAWEPGELGDVNVQLQRGEWFGVSPSMAQLVSRAKAISQLSDGLFNPAIGKIIAAAGFHKDEPGYQPGSDETIRALVAAAPSMQDIDIDGLRMRGNNPAIKLDMGGFAKGVGLGIIAEELYDAGFSDFILNAGGDLYVSGQHYDRSWRIGVRDPGAISADEIAFATVDVNSGEGVFTSGNYERFYNRGGQITHHIINPFTGRSATGASAVTVIDSDPGLADAAATAIFVAGADRWASIAQRMGIDDFLVVNDAGDVFMSASMAKRVRFETEQAYSVLGAIYL